MKKEEKSYKKHFYAAIAVIIILLVFIGLSAFLSYRNFSIFEKHKRYLNRDEAQVETWMNIKIITENFNITKQQIVGYFNISEFDIRSEASLNRLCKQYKKNCTQIVEELNKIK